MLSNSFISLDRQSTNTKKSRSPMKNEKPSLKSITEEPKKKLGNKKL